MENEIFRKLNTVTMKYSVATEDEAVTFDSVLEAAKYYESLDTSKLLNMHIDDITYTLEFNYDPKPGVVV